MESYNNYKRNNNITNNNISTLPPDHAPLTPPPNIHQNRSDNDNRNDEDTTSISSTGTVYERVLFHIFILIASSYGAMVLTQWGSPSGDDVSSPTAKRIAQESLWLKIISQWIFLVLYLRALYVAYMDAQIY
jgi:hypothetical protein